MVYGRIWIWTAKTQLKFKSLIDMEESLGDLAPLTFSPVVIGLDCYCGGKVKEGPWDTLSSQGKDDIRAYIRAVQQFRFRREHA